jgi:hypothetical protein
MQVVAHFLDGRVLKGTSLDVDPGRPICHVTPPGGAKVTVDLAHLKALYVVRSLAGDPRHDDTEALSEQDQRRRGAHPVELIFLDGERQVGMTIHYPPTADRFFVLPADPASNNQRVLVNRAALADVRLLSEAPVEPAGPGRLHR